MLSFCYFLLITCSFNSFRNFAYYSYTRLQNIWRPNIWLVFFNFFELMTFTFLQFSIFSPFFLPFAQLAILHFCAFTHVPTDGKDSQTLLTQHFTLCSRMLTAHYLWRHLLLKSLINIDDIFTARSPLSFILDPQPCVCECPSWSSLVDEWQNFIIFLLTSPFLFSFFPSKLFAQIHIS